MDHRCYGLFNEDLIRGSDRLAKEVRNKYAMRARAIEQYVDGFGINPFFWPVSSRDFRLERIRGQPLDMA